MIGELDVLFLSEAMERGCEINVVLPFPMSEFRSRKSSLFADEDTWRAFEKIVGSAARAVVAGEHRVSGNRVALEYAAKMRDGLARLRANLLDVDMVPVSPAGAPEAPGAEVLDVQELAEDVPYGDIPPTGIGDEQPAMPGYSQEIMAMLFGDVRGYSQLSEEQIPYFAEHFMGEVARAVAGLSSQPAVKNSWGDALYFVFERVSDAALFAVELTERVENLDWSQWDLPADLTMRVALHAGPVYACRDPVTEKDNCVGWHVTRVARIEPVTPPGQVYASEAFAALAAAEGAGGFVCDYVGEMALAKGFGTFPTYHIRKA